MAYENCLTVVKIDLMLILTRYIQITIQAKVTVSNITKNVTNSFFYLMKS